MMKLLLFLFITSSSLMVTGVMGFSTPSPFAKNDFFSFFTDLFKNNLNTNRGSSKREDSSITEERAKLKHDIVKLCNDKSIKDNDKRNDVVDLISKLKNISPIRETATSPLLEKRWLL